MDIKLLAKIGGARAFGLAATVGEEDERDVVDLEVGECLTGSGDWFGASQEDTVDVEGEGEVRCGIAGV